MDALPLFEFLAAKASGGARTALVTVTSVAGSSMRDPGAHLVVAEDGEWCGSLSGGCIEAAVVADARAAIAIGFRAKSASVRVRPISTSSCRAAAR